LGILKRVFHEKFSASAGTQEYRIWGQIVYYLRIKFKGKTWQESASTLTFDPDVMAHRNSLPLSLRDYLLVISSEESLVISIN